MCIKKVKSSKLKEVKGLSPQYRSWATRSQNSSIGKWTKQAKGMQIKTFEMYKLIFY